MKIIRPIQFDEKRKEAKRAKDRESQRRRRQRKLGPGDEFYMYAFMTRLNGCSLPIWFNEANDNSPRPRRRK